MDPDRIVWLVLIVMGLVSGAGLLAVRTSQAETTRVSTLFPMARLFLYRGVRVVAALLCFVIVAVGVAGLLGKFG
jgi:hypothetical protein